MAPAARRDFRQLDIADANARQPLHGTAYRGEHTAHLPIFTLKNGKLDLRPSRPIDLARNPLHADVLRGLRDTVGELDAVRKLSQPLAVWNATHNGPVRLTDMVLGMSQFVEEITVVGEKYEPFRLDIEAADGA